ncbi:ABC transporter substrate-binding protein [Haloferax sulfurifontis]|nr:extracellular solute-binding protein [Haloferax sulfurifontis]
MTSNQDDDSPSRRDILKYGGLAGLASLAGCMGGGGSPSGGGGGGGTSEGGSGGFMEEARSIGFTDNWEERRLTTLDEWPLEQRQAIPEEGQRADSSAWAESEAVQSAPWSPPEGWDETAAGEIDEIQLLNFGSLEYDPGTAAAHGMFEDRTGITINPLEITVDQAIPKETAFLQAGEGEPEGFQVVVADSLSSFAQADHLQAVDPLFGEDSMWEPIQPVAQQTINYDGNLWGGPAYLEGDLVHVNVGMLEDQGVDQAVIDKITNGEWSWDDLETCMEAFEGTDAYAWAYRGASRTYTMRDFNKHYYQAGGEFVNDDGSVTVNDEAGYYALGKMVEWLDNGWVPESVVNFGQGDLADGFTSEQFAMVPVYGDLTGQAKSQLGDAYTPTLTPEGGSDAPNPTRAGLASPNVMAINSNASDAAKLAAMVYLDARISQPTAWWEFVVEGNQSWHKRVYDEAAETGAALYPEIRGQQANLNKTEVFPQQRSIKQRISQECQQAIAGSKSPEEALDAAQGFIDTVLGQ